MKCHDRIFCIRRPIAVEDNKTDDESSHSVSPSGHPGGIALSDSEKAKALAYSMVTQFQSVTYP